MAPRAALVVVLLTILLVAWQLLVSSWGVGLRVIMLLTTLLVARQLLTILLVAWQLVSLLGARAQCYCAAKHSADCLAAAGELLGAGGRLIELPTILLVARQLLVCSCFREWCEMGLQLFSSCMKQSDKLCFLHVPCVRNEDSCSQLSCYLLADMRAGC